MFSARTMLLIASSYKETGRYLRKCNGITWLECKIEMTVAMSLKARHIAT